jgi:anthranilate synthase component II
VTAVSVLVVDNYDSFTYNLVQYLGELGAELDVVRNDQATVDELLGRGHERLIVSPGPCTPAEAGISSEAIRRFAEAGTRVLGVCLGHQALAAAFGAAVVRGEPVHGKTAEVEHDGKTIFEGLESPLVGGRYHSLVVEPGSLPDELELSARSGETVMGLRHRELPAEGVQFHPESILTADGKELLRNFLGTARDPVALARLGVEIWNAGDIDRLGTELYHEDIEVVPVPDWPQPGPFRGKPQVLRFWREVADAFETAPMSIEIEELVGLPGERAFSRFRWRQAGLASGAEAETTVWGVHSVRDGRVVRQEYFSDEAAARVAAGL